MFDSHNEVYCIVFNTDTRNRETEGIIKSMCNGVDNDVCGFGNNEVSVASLGDEDQARMVAEVKIGRAHV